MTVLKQTQRFVNEQSNKTFGRQVLKWTYGLANTSHPSGQFSWRVDVMWLLINGESLLGHEVELDHGICEWFGIGTQRWNDAQHGSIERAVDLFQ
jgi:hypothetical protein